MSKTKTKRVDVAKLKEPIKNYMLIEFSYKKIILPYEEGRKLMDALAQAEISEGYGDDFKIMPMTQGTLEFKLLSEAQYLAGKMSNLLDLPVDPSIFATHTDFVEIEDKVKEDE